MNRKDRDSAKKTELGDWLSTFKIEVSSTAPSVYGNGLQQIEVSLMVEPVRDQTISQEQLNSLTIVRRTPEGEYEAIPEQPATGTANPEWFFRRVRDTRFEYYSRAGRTTPPVLRAPSTRAIRTKLVYVSTVALGGTTVTLHARIRKDDDNVFVSDGSNQSSIKLNAVALPKYSFPDDYRWELTWVMGNTDASAHVQEWSLSAQKARFCFASFIETRPHGMIRWERNEDDVKAASNVGIALPGIRNINYDSAINVGADFLIRQRKEIGSLVYNQHVVVVLQADNNIPYYEEGINQGGPCGVRAFDIDGNSHDLQFSFDTTQSSPFGRRTHLLVNANSTAIKDKTPTESRGGRSK